MTATIELRGLRKYYTAGFIRRRRKEVLRGIDLDIQPGTITGLLGRNGAGKSTLIRCLLGLLKVSEGSCRLYGEDSWLAPPHVRKRIGYVPQTMAGYTWMRVDQILDYTAAYFDRWDQELADELLRQAEIDNWSRVSRLSEGEKQKVSIIMAVAHDPDLLILDEPVASLDPTSRREFIEMILDRFINKDKTVLFSTHITSDIERLAARVVLLRDGEIVLHDDLDTLKDNVCRLHLTGETDISQIVNTIPDRLEQHCDGHAATVTVSRLDNETERTLAESGIRIDRERLNLEEIFLELNR